MGDWREAACVACKESAAMLLAADAPPPPIGSRLLSGPLPVRLDEADGRARRGGTQRRHCPITREFRTLERQERVSGLHLDLCDS